MENNFEELEMPTGSLYLALAEENVCECILPEKKAQWTHFCQIDRKKHFYR